MARPGPGTISGENNVKLISVIDFLFEHTDIAKNKVRDDDDTVRSTLIFYLNHFIKIGIARLLGYGTVRFGNT